MRPRSTLTPARPTVARFGGASHRNCRRATHSSRPLTARDTAIESHGEATACTRMTSVSPRLSALIIQVVGRASAARLIHPESSLSHGAAAPIAPPSATAMSATITASGLAERRAANAPSTKATHTRLAQPSPSLITCSASSTPVASPIPEAANHTSASCAAIAVTNGAPTERSSCNTDIGVAQNSASRPCLRSAASTCAIPTLEPATATTNNRQGAPTPTITGCLRSSSPANSHSASASAASTAKLSSWPKRRSGSRQSLKWPALAAVTVWLRGRSPMNAFMAAQS